MPRFCGGLSQDSYPTPSPCELLGQRHVLAEDGRVASGRVRARRRLLPSAFEASLPGLSSEVSRKKVQCGRSQPVSPPPFLAEQGPARSGFRPRLSSEALLCPPAVRGVTIAARGDAHLGLGHSFHSHPPRTCVSLHGAWGGRRTPALVLDLPPDSYKTLE